METLNTIKKSFTLDAELSPSIEIIYDPKFEFLLSSKDVALGYGVSKEVIRMCKTRNLSEFQEGVHYLEVGTICSHLSNEVDGTSAHLWKGLQPHAILWTKAGVIRLGFFIKSGRAKLFRDWAEQLILGETEGVKNYHTPEVVVSHQPVGVLMDADARRLLKAKDEKLEELKLYVAKLEGKVEAYVEIFRLQLNK
jgi:hypothetical protein